MKICIIWVCLDKLENGGVHMDKKMFNKSSNFFKKEGFYVILFVCLCVVATVAAVAAKNSSHVKNAPINNEKVDSAKNNPSISMANSNDKELNEHIDAKAVQGTKPQNVKIEVPKNGAGVSKNTSSTSSKTNTKVTMTKPVEGLLARQFSKGELVYYDSVKEYMTNDGIDIKADLGKPVVAAFDGVVEDVTYDRDGEKVVLKHNNGLKTVYSNLDENVAVKKGNSIKAGSQIGKVGKTSNYCAYEKYGDHLHFEVMNGNDFVDPTAYVQYDAVK